MVMLLVEVIILVKNKLIFIFKEQKLLIYSVVVPLVE